MVYICNLLHSIIVVVIYLNLTLQVDQNRQNIWHCQLLTEKRTYRICTRCGYHFYNLRIFPNSQLILRLHGRVICHMNANFVGFQNMCNLKISDQ